MNLFIENLYQSFLVNSDNVCLSIKNKDYTYSQVLTYSHQIRNQIEKFPSNNIGIYLTDDVFMYASILAIWMEGKTYVPIHPDFPFSKNVNVINQAEIEVVLSSVKIEEDFNINIIEKKN